jgi:putative methylase
MKNIAIILSKLKVFNNPKFSLEQYTTDSEIASEILNYAYLKGDIEDKVMMDLGCGTGILGIGCLLLGAKKVYFIDMDISVLSILKENISYIEDLMNTKFLDKVVICNANVESLNNKKFSDIDTVVQNPPFGTTNKKVDTSFLYKATELSSVIYSFHKLDTQKYIEGLFKKSGFDITNKWRFRFLLKNTMLHHTKSRKYIDVGCWRAQNHQQ